MKKPKGKERKLGIQQEGANSTAAVVDAGSTSASFRESKEERKKAHLLATRREPEKRGEEKRGSVFGYVKIALQFVRESRMELKKVKWPTRKELLASTAVVIVLTLIVAFFLGFIDLGLIKLIRSVVG
jgi:preprotein translocase subunit SecE